jgi:hypothetical protein
MAIAYLLEKKRYFEEYSKILWAIPSSMCAHLSSRHNVGRECIYL